MVMRLFAIILTLTLSSLAFGQKRQGPAKLSSAEVLSAKAFLEDLMMRRFSSGLSTIVEKEMFTISVMLELVTVKTTASPVEKIKDSEIPADFQLGNLDAEKLIQNYGLSAEEPKLVSFLSTQKIKFVQVNVGLKESAGTQLKAAVQRWLDSRLKNEFGRFGKGEVTFLKSVPEVKKPEEKVEKKWWDWLDQFQHFAGTLVVAFAILVGALIWRLSTPAKINQEVGNLRRRGSDAQLSNLGAGTAGKGSVAFKDKEEKTRIDLEVSILSEKLVELVPKVMPEIESVIRSWAQSGKEGRMKIVCFAEATGKELGRLPIPSDMRQELAALFKTMIGMNTREKYNILEAIYWDLLSALNLGSEYLAPPFGYLSAADTPLLKKILVNQNTRLKTLVSMYLPDDVRMRLFKDFAPEEKLELLVQASELKKIPSKELRDIDQSLLGKFNSLGVTGDSISLELTQAKIIGALTPIEEMTLLPQLESQNIIDYKAKWPSLAFLHEWPDRQISLILSRSEMGEILAYLSFRKDMTARFLELAPPLIAEILSEELPKIHLRSVEENEASLQSLKEKMEKMVEQNEVNLNEIFSKNTSPSVADVIKINKGA